MILKRSIIIRYTHAVCIENSTELSPRKYLVIMLAAEVLSVPGNYFPRRLPAGDFSTSSTQIGNCHLGANHTPKPI